MISVEYLNHASVRIDVGPISLVSDPWWSGPCFSGGWGLRNDAPEAPQRAASATHLWVSHWHSDHLHAPSLKALAAVNPNICVLANVSPNFSMEDRFRQAGFTNIVPIHERRRLELAPGWSVIRYPTAGIDNMLVLEGPDGRFLNYNDCNLPAAALRAILAQIGPIDVACVNYNHAGKLYYKQPDEEIRTGLESTLRETIRLINPRRAIPFASSHYYRSPYSLDQNTSMLSFDDLDRIAGDEPRLTVLRVGERVELDAGFQPAGVARVAAGPAQTMTVQDYGPSVPIGVLFPIARTFVDTIASDWMVVRRAVKPLRIHVEDLGGVLTLCLRRGASWHPGASMADIRSHSVALHNWMGRPFGGDTFLAGAHFAMLTSDPAVTQTFLLLALMSDSHLGPRSALRVMARPGGWRFLTNRREEIAATFLASRWKVGEKRL